MLFQTESLGDSLLAKYVGNEEVWHYVPIAL